LNEPSNAPHGGAEKRCFRITHPYHPLFERVFELVTCRQNWGEDRLWFYDREGHLASVPTIWTDVAAVDPVVVVGAGQSLFRVADLLDLVQRIRSLEADQAVNKKMS
jgi:Family of unknown function (DUF5372)